MPPQPDGTDSMLWWRHPGAVALLAGNLVPLTGVLFFGWSVFALLLLFWLDNVVIGLYMIVRMRLLRPYRVTGPGTGSLEHQNRNANFTAAVYFFFTAVHGLFVILLFGSLELRQLKLQSTKTVPEHLADVLQRPETVLAVLVLVVSRGIELYADYRRPEFANVKANEWEMGMNFVRILLLQAVIIVGGFAAAKLGAPAAAIALLVALKIWGDLYAHGLGKIGVRAR